MNNNTTNQGKYVIKNSQTGETKVVDASQLSSHGINPQSAAKAPKLNGFQNFVKGFADAAPNVGMAVGGVVPVIAGSATDEVDAGAGTAGGLMASAGGSTIGGGIGGGVKALLYDFLGLGPKSGGDVIKDAAKNIGLNATEGGLLGLIPGGSEAGGLVKNTAARFAGGTGLGALADIPQQLLNGNKSINPSEVVKSGLTTGISNSTLVPALATGVKSIGSAVFPKIAGSVDAQGKRILPKVGDKLVNIAENTPQKVNAANYAKQAVLQKANHIGSFFTDLVGNASDTNGMNSTDKVAEKYLKDKFFPKTGNGVDPSDLNKSHIYFQEAADKASGDVKTLLSGVKFNSQDAQDANKLVADTTQNAQSVVNYLKLQGMMGNTSNEIFADQLKGNVSKRFGLDYNPELDNVDMSKMDKNAMKLLTNIVKTGNTYLDKNGKTLTHNVSDLQDYKQAIQEAYNKFLPGIDIENSSSNINQIYSKTRELVAKGSGQPDKVNELNNDISHLYQGIFQTKKLNGVDNKITDAITKKKSDILAKYSNQTTNYGGQSNFEHYLAQGTQQNIKSFGENVAAQKGQSNLEKGLRGGTFAALMTLFHLPWAAAFGGTTGITAIYDSLKNNPQFLEQVGKFGTTIGGQTDEEKALNTLEAAKTNPNIANAIDRFMQNTINPNLVQNAKNMNYTPNTALPNNNAPLRNAYNSRSNFPTAFSNPQ